MSNVDGAIAGIIVVLGLGAMFLALLYGVVQISKQWKAMLVERVAKALKRRRNTKDHFRDQYGYSWDYFMAFRVYDEDDPVSDIQMENSVRKILDKLTKGGLEFRLFYSLQHKEVFCKIRAPLSRLQRHADMIDYKLPFDPVELKALCEKGRDGLWDPLKIPEKSDMTHLGPYEFIYGNYEFDPEINGTRKDLVNVYKKWPRISPEQFLKALGTTSTEGLDMIPEPITKNPLTIDNGSAYSDVENPHGVDSLAESAMFRGVDRMKLIHAIISNHNVGGCYLDPYQLMKDVCILAYSPLHDMVELRDLESEWLTLMDWPWNQPLEKIKNYFGEKIGLYFKWLGLYTTWLIPAAIVGFGIWINVAADDNNPDAASVPYFAGFMGIWSAMFLEHWKRTEKTTAMKWGMVGFEEEEQNRPQFKGEKILSPITGKPTLYFSRVERFYRSLFSQSVVILMVMIVIAVIAVIFAIRIAMASAGFTLAGVDLSSVVASILIALQIQFLNGFFGEVAIKLNNQENHRTDTEYEDSLIAKTFCFQFVNSFASLFYIAFVKPFIPTIDPCSGSGGSCMGELQTTLGTIFLTRLAVGNLTEVGIPLVKAWLEKRRRKDINNKRQDALDANQQFQKQHGSNHGLELNNVNDETITDQDLYSLEQAKREMSDIEKTFIMPEYHVMLGPFDDYAEMTIQFGYTTMFVAAFPLATLLSLINNYVEMRVDGWKLCHVYRRPEPRSCEDIGTWYVILELISLASIFINSGLVAYTGSNTIDYTWPQRAWIFIMMASGLFGIRLLVAWLIPDVPESVTIQLLRSEYINGKVMDNIEDEDDSMLAKNNFQVPNFLVLGTDDDPM